MKVKAENFITIPGWAALPPYNLKGNDLIIFAIIYGFCQVKGQCFCGSLAYLQEWTNSTRGGVIKNLRSLLDKNMIIKIECKPTNHYIVNPAYNITFDDPELDGDNVETSVNKVETTLNKVNEDSKQCEHNNIDNTTNKYKNNLELSSRVEEIISYLNSVCHTKFKSNTAATKKLIKSRLDEGFSLEDFKNVIECKYQDWGENPIRFSNGQWSNEFLRPATLFGNKFESYVYEASARQTSPAYDNSVSSEIDPERSKLTF